MNKQIEEMAAEVCPLYKEYGSCKKCDDELDIGDTTCLYQGMAKLFANAGYRKQSDTVREVFAELKTVMIDEHRYPIIGELKKKYEVTEDEICI